MSTARLGVLFRRWWWLVLNSMVVAGALAAVWVNQQPVTYSSTGSFVVRARVTDESDLVRATATLTSSDEIVSTLRSIAVSELIEGQAQDQLGLSGAARSTTRATSTVVPGTNVVLVGARSDDPQLALDMAIAVGSLTETYVQDLKEVFFLEPLDPPNTPSESATRGRVTVGAAATLGLLAGLGSSAALERRMPKRPSPKRLRNIVDRQSSAYTRRYLEVRMREEVARSRGLSRSFSIGVLQLLRRRHGEDEDDRPARFTDSELTAIAESMRGTLSDHAVLGHVGGGQFAAILPDLDVDQAKLLVDDWRRKATELLLRDNIDRDIRVTVSACEYDSSLFIGDPEAELVASRL